MNRSRMRFGVLIVALAATALPLGAQSSGQVPRSSKDPLALDRTVQPTPGAQPRLVVPKWTRTRLANGAELVVIERRDLPLVAVNMSFVGGTYNYEPADKLGVAGFTAAMLTEGTTTRTGDQIADAQQLLGTQIGIGVGGEAGQIGFTALKDKWEPALALVADMLVNPTFPAPALERLRGRTLVQLQQAKDQPNTIGQNVFSRVLYGAEHPYGRVITESTVNAVTRDDVVAFHRAYFRPGRAVITVSGDVTPAQARTAVERALAAWPAGGERPTWQYPAVPAERSTAIYLVDKPGSAQSVFNLGHPGPARSTKDYYALQVMNTILGGLFQSRLNHNIREVKGYSYGVGSGFAYGRGPGAFNAGGGIVTAKTDSALIEFMRELRGVQGGRAFTADEIAQGKDALIQSLPRRFASVNGTAAAIGSLYVEGLPETYYEEFVRQVNAISSADLVRVAREYVDLDNLNIVIVGDRKVIEAPLRATNIAPIVILDADAKPPVTP